MNQEKITIDGTLLEVASYKNHKEATILLSVLDQPDLSGRIIDEESGEKYHKTIIGFPVVAKLKKNIFGQVSDFGGHELIEEKLSNGKKRKRFDTIAIGTVMDSWIEDREVDGYDGEQKCILVKCKLWVSRYPEYFKVFDKLWADGQVKSSWELTATKVVEDGLNKIYKAFEFIGLALLGSTKTPAVPGAGVIEYAELEQNYNTELEDALEKDIADLDIDYEEKEDTDLAEGLNKETPVENTELENKPDVAETVELAGENKPEVIETSEINENSENFENNVPETASLTENDLYVKINQACKKKLNCSYGWINYWFPAENTVWYKVEGVENSLDYKLFTYTVENDEVTVSEPQDVQLTVSVAEFENVLASKNEEIENLKAELAEKEEAVIKAGEKITQLNVEVSELVPYKEAAEKAEQERIETEIAEAKENLKQTMMKTKLFTEEELTSPEIAELIESRNEASIKTLIAERYIASFNFTENTTEVASVEESAENQNSAVASLNTDDVDESPSEYMRNFLSRK